MTQSGRYKTIGKTVFIDIYVQPSGAGTCSGTITIANLPVTAGARLLSDRSRYECLPFSQRPNLRGRHER